MDRWYGTRLPWRASRRQIYRFDQANRDCVIDFKHPLRETKRAALPGSYQSANVRAYIQHHQITIRLEEL